MASASLLLLRRTSLGLRHSSFSCRSLCRRLASASTSTSTSTSTSISKTGRADDNLKRVLSSEIEFAKREPSHSMEIAVPDDFPFEILDNSGDQAVILKREREGETIQVTVLMDNEEEGEQNEDSGGDDDDKKEETSIQPTLYLVATVERAGSDRVVEFCCSLNANTLSIENMVMKNRGDDPSEESAYQGPKFKDLDESLQKALHNYLEVRGVDGSMYDFLQDYMLVKDGREYMAWLKNMKAFVEG